MILKRYISYFRQKRKWCRLLQFYRSCIISDNSIFEGLNKIYWNTIFDGELGLGSYIANDAEIYGKVGRFTSIGPRVVVVQGIHPYKSPFATTSPYFFSIQKQNGNTAVDKNHIEEFRYADFEKHPVVIGSDVWICSDSRLISGVKIGDGAVVMAGAIVSKDVPPYAIVGGVPAKILGYRYDNDTINRLLANPWWNKDIQWLNEHHDLLRNVDLLLKEIDC